MFFCFVNTNEALYISLYYFFENEVKIVFFVLFQSEILHEAEVMMKLDHPNIVRIIGICVP